MAAQERVRRECRRLREALPRPPLLSVEERDDGRRLRAEVEGPDDSPFQAARFSVEIEFGHEYPFKPPAVRFASPRRVFHPNVCPKTGGVCLDILNDSKLWSPAFGIERLLVGVASLLSEPRTEHGCGSPALLSDAGLNAEALELLRADPPAFASRAAAAASAVHGEVVADPPAGDQQDRGAPAPLAAPATPAAPDGPAGSTGLGVAAAGGAGREPSDLSGACCVAAVVLLLVALCWLSGRPPAELRWGRGELLGLAARVG